MAPTLVLDGEPDFQRAVDLCGGGQSFEVGCLRADPDSTHEARSASRVGAGVAQKDGRDDQPHAIRVGMLFRRASEGAVAVVAPGPPG